MLTTPEGTDTPPRNSILYFQVKEIALVHSTLVAKGAANEQAPHPIAKMPDHELWIGFLKDPDGNLVGLMEEKL